jgi:hypothetical protein|tara:strand:- start:208 stop:417 length:210 start_codon:yes stop_codon:yes gene_type:complete
MDILLGVFLLGLFLVLISGAYLLFQDSNKIYDISVDIRKQYPKLSRLEVKLLAREKFKKEMEANHNENS